MGKRFAQVKPRLQFSRIQNHGYRITRNRNILLEAMMLLVYEPATRCVSLTATEEAARKTPIVVENGM